MMQAPRANAAPRISGLTMTQAALEAASWLWYLGWLRKLNCCGVALSSGARPSILRLASPCNSPPSNSTIEPRSSVTRHLPEAQLFNAVRIQDLEDFIGDIQSWIDIYRVLQNQVVFFSFSHLLDHFVGALNQLLQLFIFTGVQVFLKFTALALKITILLHQLLLPTGKLPSRQGGGLTLKGISQRLQCGPQVDDLLFALGKLLLKLELRRLGRTRLPENPVVTDKPDPELLGLSLHLCRHQQTAEQNTGKTVT